MAGRSWKNYLPVKGFTLARPVVIFQSDDWGFAGVRDREGFEALKTSIPDLGVNPYDFYSLETAEDLKELYGVLFRHHDTSGRNPSLVANLVAANLDTARFTADGLREMPLCALNEGLPEGWVRDGLLDAYREGLERGFLYAGLHGLTHWNAAAAREVLEANDARSELMHTLLGAGTAMIPFRTPWMRYEYWNGARAGWADAATQHEAVARAAVLLRRFPGASPVTACAPGYRANSDTRAAWRAEGIRVAQYKFESPVAPHYGADDVLTLYRNVEFEPALDPAEDVVERALAQAGRAIAAHIPAVVCVHSINFHSTIRDFRTRTLACLDRFLGALEERYPSLLYWNDGDVLAAIQTPETAPVVVESRWQTSVPFRMAQVRWRGTRKQIQ